LKRFAVVLSTVTLLALATVQFAQNSKSSHPVPLPSSKMLTVPSPGHVGFLNSFPARIALSPNGQWAAILNEGYGTEESGVRQSISVLNLQNNQVADFPDDRLAENAHQSYFLGLVFSSDGERLYASLGSISDPTGKQAGDTGNGIAVYSFRDGQVKPERFMSIAPQKVPEGRKVLMDPSPTPAGTILPYPAGMALVPGEGGDQLLVANNIADNVVLLDAARGGINKHFDVSTYHGIPNSLPYEVVVTRDGHRAYCSLWNASRVAELDLKQGKVKRLISLLKPDNPVVPGSHPTALLLSPDEKVLYVALANSDRIAAVATDSGKPVRFFDTSAPGQNFPGTYPSALAQSQDGRFLFVADASLNAVAVFDTTRKAGNRGDLETAIGFIPTDWYPSALAVKGDDLIVTTAKGTGTVPNSGVAKTQNEKHHRDHPYIATLLRGSVARLNIPQTLKDLEPLTAQVRRDNLFQSDPGKFSFRDGTNPIKHVIYILKENRAYDQILGDLKVGNGDPSLVMFGEDVTPNEHKLALEYGVLDNFYCSGEVSGNGHVWSNAAITTDFTEKDWQIGYRGGERTYEFIGSAFKELPMDRDESDVDDPGTGYIWDSLARHGRSYRIYGEFLQAEWCDKNDKDPKCSLRTHIRRGEPLASNVGDPHGSASPWPWPVPVLKRIKPTKPGLREHFDPLYPDFQMDYPDQLRADEFLNEFNGFVRARQERKAEQLPAFILLYLPTDHTAGTRPNMPQPVASVADNDLAVGRVVEAVSHSPYWDDTAIFIIEDDAQNGADHVDAHRSIAFAISKYSPASAGKAFVDSRFYTTVNMVHSMEELLGLPPMNQNDAHAPVMAALFAGSGNHEPYTADWRNRDNGMIYRMNPEKGQGAKESEKMNFTRPDAVNTDVLNAILWRDRKGDAPLPAPKHAILPR
jgi:DNA-binding beta-propeller fold protein YncE